MGKSPLAKSLLIGSVLQLVMVGAGWLVPALGVRNNVYPIVGTTIAALMGAHFSRRSPGVPLRRGLIGGALAGGGGSLIGASAAVLAGAVPGAAVQTVLIATATGAVAGLLGAMLGRVVQRGAGSGER